MQFPGIPQAAAVRNFFYGPKIPDSPDKGEKSLDHLAAKVGKTMVALVVDRSGSMSSVSDLTKRSVEELITGQQAEKVGEVFLTVSQFNDQMTTIYDNQPVGQVDINQFSRQYDPSGVTALDDAIGQTIMQKESQIEAMPSFERPTRVVIAILTDGYENASRNFTAEKVKNLVLEKQKLGWEFIFLSADDSQELEKVQERYGFAPNLCASYANENVALAIGLVGAAILAARHGKEKFTISEEDRQRLGKPKGLRGPRLNHTTPPKGALPPMGNSLLGGRNSLPGRTASSFYGSSRSRRK